MKYLKYIEQHKKSPMKRLLDSGTDIEIVKDYKSKLNAEQKEKIGEKNKEYFDNVERWTKENDEEVSENYKPDNISDIKLHLISERFEPDEYKSVLEGWIKFVDKQKNGDCQGIVSSIMHYARQQDLPSIKSHFGEIKVEIPSDENNKLFTHHWITIDDEIYEFSKGTLKDNIDFYDIYDVDPEDIERYHEI
jgi:hypothetical protein